MAAMGVLVASSASAQDVRLPEGFVPELIVGGLTSPVDLTFTPDGRVFIAEKGGVVKVVDDGSVNAEPFIDLSAEVNNVGDRGLVGIAVHPRFPELPFVYLSYVYDPPEVQALTGDSGSDGQGARVSRLIRVAADPATGFATAIPGSAVLLLGTNSTFENIGNVAERNTEVPSCERDGHYVRDCLPADEHSHTIGRIRFGPDGALYVGSGDGSDFNGPQPYHLRVQSLDSLAGKLLRIDPMTGQGLSHNPFFDGDPDSNRSKVLDYGLRNPYSYTFDPTTWEPVIADVGWATWEMIKVGTGLNFGWPCYEGGDGVLLEQTTFSQMDECQAIYAGANGPITAPAYAYNREGTGGAILAGDIYTGNLLPEQYQGALFITDYYAGWIRTVTLAEGEGESQVDDFASVHYPVQAVFGPDGQFYYLNVWGGELVRLRYTASLEQPLGPVLVANVGPTAGQAPLFLKFDASGSYDPAGGPVTYLWTFAPGNTTTIAAGETFFFAGEHTVTLTVTNEVGVSTSADFPVHSGVIPPTAVIASPVIGTSYTSGDVIRYSGSGTAPDGSDLPPESLSWSLRIHYPDHIDPRGLPPATVGESGAFYAADRGETSMELCLAVSTNGGLKDTTCTLMQRR